MQESLQSFYHSPIGWLHLKSYKENLVGLEFSAFVNESLCVKETKESSKAIMDTIKWLDIYFSGEIPTFMPQIAFQSGSSFAQEVWELLLQIPYGTLSTYGTLAQTIAQKHKVSKMSAQAIGGAVGRNPIAIIIPCHRIIGVNKNLTGFSGGLDKKIALLNIEGVKTTELKIPK